MTIEIEEIKQLRKKYGLTQSDLAKLSGVSQSLIAKVEAGRLDPTFSKAKKIFDALNSLSEEKEMKAGEIMTKKIISVETDELVGEAVKKMKKHQISQMPVIENHKSIGLVSESILLDALIEKKKPNLRISEIMGDAPPIVSATTSAKVISNLLRFYPVVIVSEEGRLVGLITKADLIGKIA